MTYDASRLGPGRVRGPRSEDRATRLPSPISRPSGVRDGASVFPSPYFRSIPMNRCLAFATLDVALVLGSAGNANAFFGLGGGCGSGCGCEKSCACEQSCGCEKSCACEQSCGCEISCGNGCCNSCHRGCLLSGLCS